MIDLTLSAFADEYADSFDGQLAICKELGIPCIELRFIDGKNICTVSDEVLDEVEGKLKAYGMGVSAIGSPIGKIKLDGNMEEHLALAERAFAIAKRLGAKYVRIFSFYLPEGKTREECKEEVFAAMEKIILLAEKYGVTPCHENEAKIYGESPECCLQLLQYFEGRLKAVFDMGNFVLDGHDPYPSAYNTLKDYIAYFHIKDSLYRGAIVPPGLGEASVAKILADFSHSANAPCFATLEPHLETFDGLNRLKGMDFENPYRFESREAAFLAAIRGIKEILTEE
jgi:sugar phosphate isomerase/epimerase